MGEDIQRRLRRLGVVKGARTLKPAASRPRPASVWPFAGRAFEPDKASDGDEPAALDALLPGGYLAENHLGACYVVERVYPLTHPHGEARLEQLGPISAAPAAAFSRDPRFAGLNLRDFLFLDTETTGLSGAGTFAFMVGVAFYEGDAFVVRQYFLRDHADEAAMLELLGRQVEERPALVTFNGRSFDLPLLDNRYLMNRLDVAGRPLLDAPHLDLLPPARRLWRARIGSCSLGSLEQNLLGLRREQADVPGWAIPGLYMDYLRSGNARPLLGVFYHNEIDLLSMVALGGRVLRLFARPEPEDDPLDRLSLARWQLSLGLAAEARTNLEAAAAADLPLALYHETLHLLGAMLKREGRREEAARLWQQIAVTSFDDVAAYVELAKHYEWQHGDAAAAREWTLRAVALAGRWPAGRAAAVRPELEHRLARLERKLSAPGEE